MFSTSKNTIFYISKEINKNFKFIVTPKNNFKYCYSHKSFKILNERNKYIKSLKK